MEIVAVLPNPFSDFPINVFMGAIVWFIVALPAVCALLYINIYLSLPLKTYSFYQKYKITNAYFKRDVKEILY